jgi:hypothetical protein
MAKTSSSPSKDKRHIAKRLLQVTVAIGGVVPVLAGAGGVFLGLPMLDNSAAENINLSSHYCYLSGILMAIGFGFWSTIPAIETKTSRFQLLTALVFIGGLGRLYALVKDGAPNDAMLFGLMMELIVTPLLALWQSKLAR